MLTIYGIKLTYDTLFGLAFAALFFWSEYLGGNKEIESNNVASQVYRLLRLRRTEDDKLKQIIDILNKK